jgi:hypothetical protein
MRWVNSGGTIFSGATTVNPLISSSPILAARSSRSISSYKASASPEIGTGTIGRLRSFMASDPRGWPDRSITIILQQPTNRCKSVQCYRMTAKKAIRASTGCDRD